MRGGDLSIVGARTVGGAVVDIVMRDGLVESVSPEGLIPPPAGLDRVDAAGRWVVPGLWDNHVHFAQWVEARRRIDLGSADSVETVRHLVADALPRYSPVGPLIGFGIRPARWAAPPTRSMLDDVVGHRPAVIVSGDLHGVWLNEAAARLFDVTADDRGMVTEADAFALLPRLDGLAAARTQDDERSAVDELLASGVVGITDFEMARNADEWRRRRGGGIAGLRVEIGFYPEMLEEYVDLGLRTGDELPETEGTLTLGRLKIISDGSLNTRTAACRHPYLEDGRPTADYGTLNVEAEELARLLDRAHAAGIEAAVHAIGDRAVGDALTAFEDTGCAGRIEHAQLVAPADIPRLARAGVTASVQPAHALDDRELSERYWGDRSRDSFPLASLIAAGVPLALGSDAPVSPPDPWLSIDAALHRSRPGDDPWLPDERIGFATALAASTRTSVRAGENADLVLVDENPEFALVARRRPPVSATFIAGRPVWGHDGGD